MRDTGKREQKGFWGENWLRLVLTLGLAAIIAVMGYLLANPQAQPSAGSAAREAALEAIVMTAASILASFFITKIYAETTYNQSLRDHGVQIASGIMVLKRQIQSLSDWVNGKRERLGQTTTSASPELTDSVLEHIQQTLLGFHGMTDVALGGIAGVIGDALAEYESVMEQISGMRLEAREKTSEIQQEIQTASSSAEVAELQMQLEEIVARTDRKIAALARSSALPIPELPARRVFKTQCPYCLHSSSVEMIERVGETQEVLCDTCSKRFNSHVIPGLKILARPRPEEQDSTFQSEARSHLKKAQALIRPGKLLTVAKLTVERDAMMRASGDSRAPFQLQASMLADVERLKEAGLSKGVVRRFISLVYEGGGFLTDGGLRLPDFSAQYHNSLTQDMVLKAYVSASVSHISAAMDLATVRSLEVAQLLVGQNIESGETMVKQAILDQMKQGKERTTGDRDVPELTLVNSGSSSKALDR